MAESSKRSWPWKKKAQDKAASSPESVLSSPRASHHTARFVDEQDVSKILSDHARVSEEAMTQWQQTEIKLKQVSDKFYAVQAELTSKDVLVKQHARVAEEAVTGWEKAEAEAAVLKHQLDTAMQQKLATEDRVSHLDGALKECMKQLRHVREEQEQRIHDAILEKTREYDLLRVEMEAKLEDADINLQKALSEVMESRIEACGLTVALKESTKALNEESDLRAHSADEGRVLQAKLESTEKERSAFYYELQVLKKVLEIRNEEIESERKVTENAVKNQLENVKKISKLEAECHKLRILLQKKLPGPAALAQMRNEVGALERNGSGYDPKRRRSFAVAQPFSSTRDLGRQLESSLGSPRDICPERGSLERGSSNRECACLGERLVGMDDELNLLKEALAKRDGELRESRLMCVTTARKLSNVEEQLQTALKRCQRKSVSNCSCCFRKEGSTRDEAVDAWDAASALLVELDQVKQASDKGLDVRKIALMDDFAEMEKLAMTTGTEELKDQEQCNVTDEKPFTQMAASFEDKLMVKQREIDVANRKCREVGRKLLEAEEEVAALHSRNRANEADLVSLQEKLDNIYDKPGEAMKDRNITEELEDLVEAQCVSLRSGAAHEAILYDLENGNGNGKDERNGARRSTSSRSSSEVKYELNEDISSVQSDGDSKERNASSDLTATVGKIVRVVAALVDAIGSENGLSHVKERHQNEVIGNSDALCLANWRNLDSCRQIHGLVEITKGFVQGNADIAAFLMELTAVLSSLLCVLFRARIRYQTSGKEKEAELRLLSSEKSYQEFFSLNETGLLKLNILKPKTIYIEGEATGAESARSNSMSGHFQGTVTSPIGNDGGGRMESEMREWVTSKTGLGEDMLLLHQKVAVLEGRLQGERLMHHQAILAYPDLHQQICTGGGTTSTSSGGPQSREGHVWDSRASQLLYRSRDTGDLRQMNDQEMLYAAEKLDDCPSSALDRGKQLETVSADHASPTGSIDALSDTACSINEVTHSSAVQSRAREIYMGSSTICSADLPGGAHSNHGVQDINLEGEFFGSSPTEDRRGTWSSAGNLMLEISQTPEV